MKRTIVILFLIVLTGAHQITRCCTFLSRRSGAEPIRSSGA